MVNTIFERGQRLYRSWRKMLADPKRKPTPQILKEYVGLCVSHRENASWYWTLYAYRQGTESNQFLSRKEREQLRKKSGKEGALLDDKLFLHLLGDRLQWPVAELLGFSFGEMVSVGKTYNRRDETQLQSVVRQIQQKAKGGEVFVKESGGAEGRGIKCVSTAASRELLFSLIRESNGVTVFEKRIEQHDRLNAIYPDALNTLRVVTYATSGEPQLISVILRCGVDGATKDNASQGGIFVRVGRDGLLDSEAYRFFQYGVESYSKHPDTDVRFAELEIPFFGQILDLAIEGARIAPKGLVGWDIGVGQEGPVLVEVNTTPGLMAIEIVEKGLRRFNLTDRRL